MKVFSELENVGVISVKRSLGRGNFYVLNGVTGREKQNKTGTKKHTSTKIGTAQSQKRGRYPSQKRDTNLPIEPINNLKEKTTKRNMAKISFNNLPVEISIESAEAFIDHRKAIKKPLTQHAFNLSMIEAIKATNIGITPNQAIDETILAGWQTIKISWIQNRLENNETHQRNSKPRTQSQQIAEAIMQAPINFNQPIISNGGDNVWHKVDEQLCKSGDFELS